MADDSSTTTTVDIGALVDAARAAGTLKIVRFEAPPEIHMPFWGVLVHGDKPIALGTARLNREGKPVDLRAGKSVIHLDKPGLPEIADVETEDNVVFKRINLAVRLMIKPASGVDIKPLVRYPTLVEMRMEERTEIATYPGDAPRRVLKIATIARVELNWSPELLLVANCDERGYFAAVRFEGLAERRARVARETEKARKEAQEKAERRTRLEWWARHVGVAEGRKIAGVAKPYHIRNRTPYQLGTAVIAALRGQFGEFPELRESLPPWTASWEACWEEIKRVGPMPAPPASTPPDEE